MTITPDSLSYPVLCIPTSMGVYVAKSRMELERCRAVLFFKARLYEGLQVANASGHKYVVTKATISKPSSTTAQWLARFLDLSIYLHIELEDSGIASLSEIVNAVNSSIQEDPEGFEEFSGNSIEWWRTVLAKSKNINDVLKALSEPRHG